MFRSKTILAAAVLSALVICAAVFVGVPDASAFHVALAHTHLDWSHVVTASPALVALRAKEKDLVARAAAKGAEIKDDTAPEALRALEAEYDTLIDEIEQVRGEIATVEAGERSQDTGALLTADRERAAGIRKIARQLGLPETLAEDHAVRGTSLASFRSIAIDEKAKVDASTAVRGDNPGAADPAQHRTYAEAKREKPRGTDATRCMIALAAARGIRSDAAAFVTHHWGRDGEGLARALSTSVGSAGGFLVPDQMAGEVIELLRPASAVMSLGPRIVPMPRGNMSFPRIKDGATASYQGENLPAKASEPKLGNVQLQAKKLTALVPMSNDMIRFPSFETDSIVRDDMIDAIAMRGDLAFIRGQGTEFSPRGLKSFAADPSVVATNTIAASVKVGSTYGSLSQANAIAAVASVTYDLGKCELALMQADVKMRKPGWIMHPRSMTYLANLRDGNANLVYAAEMAQGKLRGKPFRITTQIPTNLAALDTDGSTPTTDGSELYLADFAEVFVGEAYGLEIAVFDGAAYVDSTGQMQSGVSNDQTVMRAIIQHDMNMRQMAAVAVLTGVRWF